MRSQARDFAGAPKIEPKSAESLHNIKQMPVRKGLPSAAPRTFQLTRNAAK